MVFSSAVFLFVFLPFVLLGYYLINPRYRNVFLLASNLLFYAWGGPEFVLVMITSIIINYVSGILIDRAHNTMGGKYRAFVLAISICANLGMLFYYKYFTFAVLNLNRFFHTNISVHEIALPIGISFFTFKGMSYIIDLYRRNLPAQKNLISVALYVSLFPELLAGPIDRYAGVNLQIDARKVDVEKFAYGVKRFIIGLSKKVLIANVLGEVVDKIFATPYTQIDTATAWVGAICYMMQIFFDFSGYSDMAIGLGKMFGFDFMENFNLPYISKSIREFWRRWHISLSTWFRDYLYIPLGGNRTGNVYVNLIIVFIATGLWHGADWTFLCWGLWHGMFLLIERIFRSRGVIVKIPGVAKWVYTMSILLIGWVLFRSKGINNAYHYLQTMFNMVDHEFIRFSVWYYLDRQILLTLLFSAIVSSKIPAFFSTNSSKVILIKKIAIYANPVCLLLLMIINIIFVINSTYNPFIYFQF
jgi:alginate O-acetyltransferase complex protein AlgI